MSIHNVTPTHVDHICSHPGCQHQRAELAHSEVVKQVHLLPDDQHPQGQTVLVIECPDGHRECFNNALEASEETSPTRDEASREQVRNVRALHKYLGLPVK